jgi:hypothetical protein
MIDPKTLKIPLVTKTKSKVNISLEGVVGSRVNAKNYSGNGHWHFVELLGKGKQIGFIYAIRNRVSGRLYIGKKQYRSLGKLTKNQESNWPWYISSCIELSNDIKLLGKENFDFIVLEEYKTKGGLSYAEVWSLIISEVNCDNSKWYNRLVNKVAWIVKEPPTARHRERLARFIEGKL